MTDTPTIFISYSHRDEKPWKDFVQTHLEVVARQDGFLVWEDRRIRGGDDWRDEIDGALEQADIAVLLISPYFLTSDFILNHEVKELLKRKEQRGLRIYPILINDCAWKSVDWLERLNLRPTDGRALASYQGNNRHRIMAGLVEEIGHLLREEDLQAKAIAGLEQQKGELGQKLGVTEEAIHSFLTILDQKHVGPNELQEKLCEIAHQYQEMQVRLEALDQDDPVIKTWIGEAKTAIDDRDYDEADALLVQAEQRDISAAHQAAAQADQRFLNAAATRALRGETCLTQLRYLDAAEHFAEAAKLVPDSESKTQAGYHAQQGDALKKGSRTLDAIAAYKDATALEPEVTRSWINLGDLHLQAGDLGLAEQAFLKARAATGRLADSDPGNAGWQRDLSVSHDRIGNVRVAQGDLEGAGEAYRASLAIRKRLAAGDPGNARWQRDLSVSHEKIGNVRVAQGDLEGAGEAYRAGLAIIERLIDIDPDNTLWQRHISVSHEKIGNVRVAQGDLEGAGEAYRAGLAIRKRLADSDPCNAGWQRDLSVSHEKIGNVRRDQGDLEGAGEAYRAGLAIIERLIDIDPDNTLWQRHISVSHEKIGDVRRDQGDLEGAGEAYRAGLAIIECLAAGDPGNAGWQRDLIVSRWKLADLAERCVSEDALDHLQAALAVAKELEASGRLLPTDAYFVETIQKRIDTLSAPSSNSDS